MTQRLLDEPLQSVGQQGAIGDWIGEIDFRHDRLRHRAADDRLADQAGGQPPRQPAFATEL